MHMYMCLFLSPEIDIERKTEYAANSEKLVSGQFNCMCAARAPKVSSLEASSDERQRKERRVVETRGGIRGAELIYHCKSRWPEQSNPWSFRIFFCSKYSNFLSKYSQTKSIIF